MCPSHNPRQGTTVFTPFSFLKYLCIFLPQLGIFCLESSLEKDLRSNVANYSVALNRVGKNYLRYSRIFFFKLNQVGQVYFILNNKIRVAFGAMFGFLKQKLLKTLNQFGFTLNRHWKALGHILRSDIANLVNSMARFVGSFLTQLKLVHIRKLMTFSWQFYQGLYLTNPISLNILKRRKKKKHIYSSTHVRDVRKINVSFTQPTTRDDSIYSFFLP